MANPYLWIAIVGGFIAFATGAGVGMNDLSNAFGTTYGAKVLTLLQICILASICEFVGAVSLGGAVTSTISGGIANPEDFSSEPYAFMYGMLCACSAAFCWLCIATWLTLPVSSTHSICGGVIGFALVYGGGGSVYWAKPQDDFPFVGGVVPIIASWFISPLLTGIVAAIVYGAVRFLVLRPKNSVNRAIYSLPIIVAIAFFLESFFVLYKGAKSKLHWDVKKSAWVAACIAGGTGAASCILIPILRRKIKRLEAKAEEIAAEEGRPVSVVEMELVMRGAETGEEQPLDAHHPKHPHHDLFSHDQEEGVTFVDEPANDTRDLSGDNIEVPQKGKDVQAEPISGDVVEENESGGSGEEKNNDGKAGEDADKKAPTTASGLEVQIYDAHAEAVYRYLQIFTAICASFAHGASDVSNAVGPFAAIYGIYVKGHISFDKETPIWILCLGGAGLIVGLSTFGIRLMRLLGEKITVITPSRGFSAELSAALVVSFASGYGIPVSSTHCITGAVIAISMVDVGIKKVRWMMVLKMYAGWVFTLVVTAVMSATFFAQGIYSPSV